MNKKNIYIFTNGTDVSLKTEEILREKLIANGLTVFDELTSDVGLIVCIGGDGTLLTALHEFAFPDIPFVGINTGHLGFFQEVRVEKIDIFIERYLEGKYQIQELATVGAEIKIGDKVVKRKALNELAIKAGGSHTIHLDISIGGSFIERFSGDGILIATPAGSTGYNYSLGGAIVDPRIKLLQVTPIAPMNSTAYRSFTSSILLPPDMEIGIVPDNVDNGLFIAGDGREYKYQSADEIKVGLSETSVHLIRFEGYDFWDKVKKKFL